MKKLVIALVVYCLLFASQAFAGTNSLNSNFPSPFGNYNKIVLSQPQATTVIAQTSCTTTNQGLLNLDSYGNLALCASTINSSTPTPAPVLYNTTGETCFNRFCSGASCDQYCPDESCGTTNVFTNGNSCPSNFSQAKLQGSPFSGYLVDSYQTGGNTVYSTVCCSTNSIVTPQS